MVTGDYRAPRVDQHKQGRIVDLRLGANRVLGQFQAVEVEDLVISDSREDAVAQEDLAESSSLEEKLALVELSYS